MYNPNLDKSLTPKKVEELIANNPSYIGNPNPLKSLRPLTYIKTNPLSQIVSPGPNLFPTIPSAQGNQLGSLPMGGPRFTFEPDGPIVQTLTTRPQRNFIGRRMIAIITTHVATFVETYRDLFLSSFLVGAQYQLGSGEPVHLRSMQSNATGTPFTINTVEPGEDYIFTVMYLGPALVVVPLDPPFIETVTVSFTIFGDTVR